MESVSGDTGFNIWSGPHLTLSTTLLTACDLTQSSAAWQWLRRSSIQSGRLRSPHLHDEDAHAHGAQYVLVVIKPQLYFLIASRSPQGGGAVAPTALGILHAASVRNGVLPEHWIPVCVVSDPTTPHLWDVRPDVSTLPRQPPNQEYRDGKKECLLVPSVSCSQAPRGSK